MKKVVLLAAILCFAVTGGFAQILNPVKWQFGAKKINDTEAVVFMKATVNPGWHIYSQHLEEGGPVPTSFTFKPSAEFELAGNPIEPTPKTKYEEVFAMEVGYFEDEVVFQQKVKLKNGTTSVSGSVEFMVCDAEQCLPPDEVPFTIAIK